MWLGVQTVSSIERCPSECRKRVHSIHIARLKTVAGAVLTHVHTGAHNYTLLSVATLCSVGVFDSPAVHVHTLPTPMYMYTHPIVHISSPHSP